MQAIISAADQVIRACACVNSARNPVSAAGWARRGGSGMLRRKYSVSSAGAMPRKNMPRQPSVLTQISVARAARNSPVGVAVCSQPASRTRMLSGTDSCSSGVPAAHSPPMPKPAMKRKMANITNPVDRPQRPVKME